MKIQSLSIVVPTNGCINNCLFCVSRMHSEDYKNQMDDNKPFYDLYLKDYIKRLEFARDNGCNTAILTGNGEPQQNRRFLTDFGLFMMLMERPFRNIEMQTTGVLLDEPYLRFLRNHVGVNTISLSVSSFYNDINQKYNGTRDELAVDLYHLCKKIKQYDFNLRLSVNLTDDFNEMTIASIFMLPSHTFCADQVTFRVLYQSTNKNTPQYEWISSHAASPDKINEIHQYIKGNGRALERLEFGQMRYSVHGMSVVLDDDCMASAVKESLKYLVLRPDCKLYSKWDDTASLVF